MKAADGRALPPRPYLPPSAAGALCSLAAAAVVLDAGWSGYRSCVGAGCVPDRGDAAGALALAAGIVAVAAAGALAGAALRRFRSGWGTMLIWIGAGLCAGALSGGMSVCERARAAGAILSAPASSLTFEVTGDPRRTTFGVQLTAHAFRDGACAGTVQLSTDEVYGEGVRLTIIGRTSALETDAWGQRHYRSGEVAEVKVVSVQSEQRATVGPIEGLRERMLAVIRPEFSEVRALIAGIVCGRTSELSTGSASDAFSRTGTTHLIAVSGSHLALLSSLVNLLLSRARARPARRALALAALMAAYVVFTGGSPSAVRSYLMVALSLVATVGGRRGHGPSALFITVVALVLTDAGVVFNLGFQLSAASVLFIQVFSPYLRCLLCRVGLSRTIAEALSLTLAAQWATLPLTVPAFGELSLVAPLANLILGPIMSALLVAGLIAVPIASLAPGFAPVALLLPDALAAASIFVAGLMAQIPYASIHVASSPAVYGAYIAAVVVYLLWADARRWQVLVVASALPVVLACHIARWTLAAQPSITVLDVGQADAILVRDGSSALLVDAGMDASVMAALARANIYRLDAVLVTHWDRDHVGGLDEVLEMLPVNRLVIASGARAGMPDDVASLDLPEIVEVEAGDVLRVGGFTCTVVWPQEPVAGEGNEESLALVARYEREGRSLTALLAGDTESAQEKQYAGEVGDIDVLKLGHHGSAVSVDGEILDILAPEVAIASAGEGNSYGHPDPACVGAVDRSGATFLCTIDTGDVVFQPGAGGFTVSCSRAGNAGNQLEWGEVS